MNGTGGGADARREPGTCDREDLRIALGALALDALDAEEADEVRAHMADCGECQVEYSSLIGVRSLMDAGLVGGLVRANRRADAADGVGSGSGVAGGGGVTWGHGRPSPDPSGRRGLRSGRSGRSGRSAWSGGSAPSRRRKFALALGGAAASAALFVGGVFAVADRVGTTTASPRPVTPVHTVSGHDDEGVVAKIDYRQVAWGTWIQVTMSHTQPYATCSLMAVAKNGRVEFASSWASDPTGKSVTVPGGVSMAVADIDHFDVVLGDHDEIEVPASTLTG